MTRNIALDNYLNNKGDWSNHIRIPLRKTGKGGWNCMTTEAWFKSGGWNEQLYGYGAEDDERHERLEQQGFPFRTIIYSPILHINHPQRDQARRNFENMSMMRSRDWTKHNWLKE
jgi:GT2 family glycosyltransferase